METKIEITSVGKAEIDCDGYANYEVAIKLGEHELTVEAYCVCGWLKPGASGDLDGSGLALWGDSQPGGWSVCDGDDQGGRLRVNGGDNCCDSSIRIDNGAVAGIEITPAMIPEWGAAVDAAAALEDSDMGVAEIRAIENAEAIRNELIERLESLCRYYAIDCPEPSAQEVYDGLDDIEGIDGLAVRFGDYKGCGAVIAWIDDDGYGMEWHPNPQSLSDRVTAAIAKEACQLIARTIECWSAE